MQSMEDHPLRSKHTATSKQALEEDPETGLGTELTKAGQSTVKPQLDISLPTVMLEKLRDTIIQRRNRVETAGTSISSLKFHIGKTNHSIRLKQGEEEQLWKRNEEVRRALDESRIELEQLEREVKEASRARAKLKQELQISRQSLRAVHLAERATKKEIEACNTAAATAQCRIECTRSDEKMVELPYNEYYKLCNKAAGTAYAHQLLSSLMKERQAAEIHSAGMFRRLKALYKDIQQKQIHMQEGVATAEDIVEENVELTNISIDGERTKIKDSVTQYTDTRHPMTRANRIFQQRNTRANRDSNGTSVQKKKSSIFKKIRRHLVNKMMRFFSHSRKV